MQQTLAERVRALEETVTDLKDLRDQLASMKQQVDARFDQVDTRFDRLEAGLRAETRAGDEDTRRQMRILHEEVIARIATLGSRSRRKAR